ncbi:MAG: NAD(P)-binding domain-containing protein, partial [Pseudomonadota bacterium]
MDHEDSSFWCWRSWDSPRETSLATHGHEVAFTFGRDEAKLAQTAEQFGAHAMAPDEAAAWADAIAITTPYAAAADAVLAAGDLTGKTVWDCTNPMKPDFSGLQVGGDTSAAEELQKVAGDGVVIKGIPPFAELLHSDEPTLGGEPVGSFVCGPDGPEKAVVTALLKQLPANPVDGGPLENARSAPYAKRTNKNAAGSTKRAFSSG